MNGNFEKNVQKALDWFKAKLGGQASHAEPTRRGQRYDDYDEQKDTSEPTRRHHTEQDSRQVAAKMSGKGILRPSGNISRQNHQKSAKHQPLDADFEPTEEFPRPPRTEAELVLMLRRTPKNVLSDAERQRIASAMGFRTEKIRNLVLPKSKITFVRDTDMMGPLMLDKLYQSGFSHFPVLDKNGQVVGILHTSALNALEIKDTTIAAELLDEAVYYLRDDYTIEQALSAFLRTNSFFFLVVNKNGNLQGLITYRMLVEHLLGEIREEDFDADRNLAAVLRRKL